MSGKGRSVTRCPELYYPHKATGKFNWDQEIRTMERGAVTCCIVGVAWFRARGCGDRLDKVYSIYQKLSS